MFNITKFWGRISLQKKLYLIFGLMTVLVILELLTLKYAMTNLTAVRAFVYGESVWSKAQKDSVYYLKRMAISKDEADFKAYQSSLFVPQECRIARLELEKKHPDMDLVRRGFINGNIHPDEVGPILHMIQAFSWLEHIARALQTWKEADELLQKFEIVADKYHLLVMSSVANPELEKKYSDEIHDLNFKIGKAEDRFSEALQEGARWLENVVLISLLSLVFIVEFTGLLLVFFFGRSLSGDLNKLISTSEKIGNGEFEADLPVNSEDEVGRLTQSINHMGRTIQKSHYELEKKIAEAIKSRDEFYSIASHELKTPVTSIQLSLQMLEKDLQNTGKEFDKEKTLARIKKSIDLSRKLTNLQDTLMDVTRFSSGMLKMDITRQDLSVILKEVIEEARVSEPKIEISFLGPEHCEASFDSIRLSQVIRNLINNALTYGEGLPVRIELKDLGDKIHVSVSDQGHGIPENLRAKIFDPFFRANPDLGISGFGVGLYISREIMLAHGGSLNVTSSSDKGTTFLVVLPKQK